MKRISRSLLWLFLVVAATIVLDQTSKIHAEGALRVWEDPVDLTAYRGRRVPLLTLGNDADPVGHYVALNLNYVRNQGAAWGMLADAKDHFRVPFFFCIIPVFVVTILYYIILIFFFFQAEDGIRDVMA